jgi:hypothetical protein
MRLSFASAAIGLLLAGSACSLPSWLENPNPPPPSQSPYVYAIPPSARFTTQVTAEEARQLLESQGYQNIAGLERVGDYWEAAASIDGNPVTVYLYKDGRITTSPSQSLPIR